MMGLVIPWGRDRHQRVPAMSDGKRTSFTLTFREDGSVYKEAKKVADSMNLSIEQYLLACIEEGHHDLRGCHRPTDDDLEIPAYMRRKTVTPLRT